MSAAIPQRGTKGVRSKFREFRLKDTLVRVGKALMSSTFRGALILSLVVLMLVDAANPNGAEAPPGSFSYPGIAAVRKY